MIYPMRKHPFFLYFFSTLFILGWWVCFQPKEIAPCYLSKNRKYQVENAPFLEPIPRDTLHASLSGDFKKMRDLFIEWDLEAKQLVELGYTSIQRMSSEEFREAILLYTALDSAKSDLRIIPQTHVAATILLAVAPENLVALPMGLRMNQELFPASKMGKVSLDCQSLDGEITHELSPHLAFVASYSNPVFLKMLSHQSIPQVECPSIASLQDVYQTVEEVAAYSEHPLEGKLLSLFMKSAMIAVDNRLECLKHTLNKEVKNTLFLFGERLFFSPEKDSLTGELLERLGLKCFGKLMTLEDIEALSPDLIVLASQKESSQLLTQKVAYVNQSVQDSPTQFTALAYRDLAACLMEYMMHE